MDHTAAQVMAGSLLGFCEACLWWYGVQRLQHRFNHVLGKPLLRIQTTNLLVHNYALPLFLAEQRVVAKTSRNIHMELQWYQDQTNMRVDAMTRLFGTAHDTHGRMDEE